MRLRYFLFAFFASMIFFGGMNLFQNKLENFFYAQISYSIQEMPTVEIPQKPKPDLDVRSAISLKIELDGSEKILFRKKTEEILPIASLTKLMTALIVLEDKNYDPKNLIVVSAKAAIQEDVANYGNLKRGQKLSQEELLNLMLVYSSNDAAFALSEVVGTENFVEEMNQKAKELAMENTHFVNPTGLDPETLYYHPPTRIYFNYSTAKDLAKLTKYILKEQPLIFETTLKDGPFSTINGISEILLPENAALLGGKTGYTDEAGGCLIFLFLDGKRNVILNVILGTESAEGRIKETQKLVNWIDDTFHF